MLRFAVWAVLSLAACLSGSAAAQSAAPVDSGATPVLENVYVLVAEGLTADGSVRLRAAVAELLEAPVVPLNDPRASQAEHLLSVLVSSGGPTTMAYRVGGRVNVRRVAELSPAQIPEGIANLVLAARVPRWRLQSEVLNPFGPSRAAVQEFMSEVLDPWRRGEPASPSAPHPQIRETGEALSAPRP
ncbi:MAG: hypothetical protein AAGF12_23330 [Myxococcota bacterium]